MNVCHALDIAYSIATADGPVAVARAYMKALASALPPSVSYAVIYGRSTDGSGLTPLASRGAPLTQIPDLPFDEVNNPVVVSALSNAPRLVEEIGSLSGVGPAYEALRNLFQDDHALLAAPLMASRGPAATVVLVLAGDAVDLGLWRADAAWLQLGELAAKFMARSSVRQTRADTMATPCEAVEWLDTSQATQKLHEDILLLADSPLSVLITGETGVGKDHTANLIHQASTRRNKPFVAINCACLPRDLIEAELFGSVRGAYTGSVGTRDGLVAAADGGTMLLDEIGDMPLALQGSLLRLLNEKKYRPLGSTREYSSDFRLLCATHRSLEELVANGSFREDLYFRICQYKLHVSPLRERPEDIAALVHHARTQFNGYDRGHVRGIDPDAIELLKTYRFPGNVRELRSIVMAACERIAPGSNLDAATIGKLLASSGPQVPPEKKVTLSRSERALFDDLLSMSSLQKACSAFEMHVIKSRLRRFDGSRKRAAQSLGITTRTLARKTPR